MKAHSKVSIEVSKYQFDTLDLYFRRTHSFGIKGKIKKYPPVRDFFRYCVNLRDGIK